MSDIRPAVVVGGGAGGVLATVQLLAAGWPVVLIDPRTTPGRGVAQGFASPWHLLGSPVDEMSALPDKPDDFLRWCRMRCPRTQPFDFVPRGWYGEYLSETLRAADSGRLTVHRASVSRIFDAPGGGFTVLLSGGVVIPAAHVVLALGEAAPADPLPLPAPVRQAPSYIGDPGEFAAPVVAAGDGPVLLIGTGPTAVDVTLALAHTHPGISILAVSRHGLTPQPHRRRDTAAGRRVEPVLAGSLARLLRTLRSQAAETGDWHAVMDAHRPHWNRLWDGLSEPEQRRFLRHAARFWEVHRHRVAPAVADRIAALRAGGTLRVAAGEVCGLAADPHGLVATIRYRGGDVATQRFAAVVNCTGPGRVVESSPLVRSLIAEGIARPGPYRLGLDTDAHGALVRRDGSVNPALWTLGPPRRGVLWETSAVPEIRAQAQALARRLTAACVRASIASGARENQPLGGARP
ncbi:MAG TPA: FAD/NAD(P)-binding protein [Candidatus Limnocylindrales bacterium]